MSKREKSKKEYKFLGVLKEEIAEYWNIKEHKNKPILVYEDRKKHVIDNHLKDFGSIKEIEDVYDSLHNIIKNPDYVFYNTEKRGLEYYKRMKDEVCVAVRINAGKFLKVKSWYPANKAKLVNRMKKEEVKVLDNENKK